MATPLNIRYFDDYVKETGWGLYNNFLLGLACTCNFVQAATYVALPLALVLSTCNDNFIPEKIVLRIFTTFFLGSCVGGLVANFLSDRYGRKRYISYSLMFIFMSTFIAAFAYNAYVIIGAALFVGVGLEANALAIKLLVIEILPTKLRGTYMVFCNIFWTIGYIFTTALTILLETPLLSTARNPDPSLTTWRILFAVVGGLNIVLACACALIEESPRYFLQMGKSYLAYLVLKQIYAINNSDFAENFKVKEEEIKHLIPQHDLFYQEPVSYWDIFKKLTWRFCQSLKFMFSQRFSRTTWVLILLKIPVLVVGLLQLNTILAKVLTSSTLPNITATEYKGLDFVYPVFKPLTYMSTEEYNKSSSICEVNDNNRIFFTYYLVLGSAMVPGIIISMLVVDWLGRKFILFTGLLLSGSSFLILSFIEAYTIQLLSSCVIMASISSVVSIVSLVSLEGYPTAVRGTAYGVTNFFGLLAATLFVNFIVIEPHIFMIIVGVVCLCLSVSITFLPEMRRKPIIE